MDVRFIDTLYWNIIPCTVDERLATSCIDDKGLCKLIFVRFFTTGIISRLDYLEYIGVEIIWLSPIYPSLVVDFGYDISEFTNVDPIFGTLEDFDELIKAVHSKGMK